MCVGLFSASAEDGALAPVLQEVLASLPWSKDRPSPIQQRQNLAAKEQSRGRRAYCSLQILSAACVEALFGM